MPLFPALPRSAPRALSRRSVLLGAAGMLAAPRVLRAAGEGGLRFRHAMGEIVLPAPARRVVSLGANTQDPLLALGVVPVAIRRWYGDYNYGVWPWAQDRLGDASPVVIGGEISAETVASLRPDLIVGIGSGMSGEEYALLSQIAPVLMQAEGTTPYGTSWQAMTEVLGRATGREEEAGRLVAGLEAEFAAIRARHPDWQRMTAVAAWQDSGQTGAFTADDTRARFLREIGFGQPAGLRELSAIDGFYTTISSEDFTPIDADLLVWISDFARAPDIAALPMRRTMRAFREGREILADTVLTGALSFGTVLSLPYALREIEPEIVLAVDGDPATVVPSAARAGLAP